MISGYLKAVSLSIVGIFDLLILGVVYVFKSKGKKLLYLDKHYILLYFASFLMLISEFVTQSLMETSTNTDFFTILMCRLHIFIGFFWNICTIIYVVCIVRDSEGKEIRAKRCLLVMLVLTLLSVIPVFLLPLNFIYNSDGFYSLDGILFYVYSMLVVFCNCGLLGFVFIKRKKLPTAFVILSFLSLGFYGINVLIENFSNTNLNDFGFIHSLFTFSLYFTTENQDRKMLKEFTVAKKESEKLDNQKTKFLLNMSHEIRTPLNAIMGYSEYLLMNDLLEKNKVEIEGKSIFQASSDLLDLINNILDVSRIESGKESLVEIDYKLDNIIINVNNKITSKLESKDNLKFSIDLNEQLPCCYHGDASKIERIITSILLNSVEYALGGEVKLKIDGTRGENYVDFVIQITNTGNAINKDNFYIDFDSITSLDSQSNIDSNVLGIVISRKLIEILGGSIDIENNDLYGTVYTIKFRQVFNKIDAIGNINDKLVNSVDEEIDYSGKSILVVDDDHVNLMIAKRLLTKFSINVDIAGSGQECLDMLKQKKYDLVFLDHMMPVMDGVETLKRMIAEYNDNCPDVIALTANSSDDARREYLALGFKDYLTKPINSKVLGKLLKEFFK